MVSGAAAVLLELTKLDENSAVLALSQATPIGQELGAGELDLYQAVLAARKK